MKNRKCRVVGTMIAVALAAIQSLAQSTYEPYTFTTLAGGGGFVSADVAGNAAQFNLPTGVTVDGAGNVYVSDTFNHVIRKVAPTGEVTTLAGLAGSTGSANGTGSGARFYFPNDVAVDTADNVYVADESNQTIRKVTPAGEVTTLAGLAGSPGSANGTGSNARFNYPAGVAVDSAGNVYVADFVNCTIRKVTPEGVVTTLAGRAGVPGSANGTNGAARFAYPQGIAVDSAGNLYVSDSDNATIRKVTPVGTNWVVTTLAGLAGNFGGADGPGSAARFVSPKGGAVDSAGNFYMADNDNHTIRMVSPVGTNWVVTTLAGLARHPGSADGTGDAARFFGPFDVAVDRAGNLYVADGDNNMIRKVTPVGTNWVVTTFAGLGGYYGTADGPASIALFKRPASVAVDSADIVYVADQGSSTVRKVTSDGVVTTLAGLAGNHGSANGTGLAARFSEPAGVAVDGAGDVYVTDTGNSTIRKVTPTGTVTTLAGLAGLDASGNPLVGYVDATGSGARFAFPSGIAVDSATNLYIADTFNSAIRKVTPARVVSTLAGTPQFDADGFPIGGSADGTGTTARFFRPSGIAVDSATNLYVADTFNHTIRKVSPTRVVTTLAGGAGSSGSGDGIGTDARFNYPSGIAVDSATNLYVADTYNNTIRKLTQSGTNWVVTTLGGAPGIWGSADGSGSAARFSNPNGVAVDSAGNLYVADFYLNTIRKGYPPPLILNPGFTDGQFGFVLTVPTGQSVVVEYSTDLLTWLPLWTNTFASTLNFTDPQSGTFSNRFYRAHLP